MARHIRRPKQDNPLNEITADTPLIPLEQKFITAYIKHGSATQALIDAGVLYKNRHKICDVADKMLNQPNVQAEINRVMEELKKETVATADEVMTYFTSVMRGEIKDQFGLEAPLAERTKAAQEIAKRTIDLDNKKAGFGDSSINVTLSWDD